MISHHERLAWMKYSTFTTAQQTHVRTLLEASGLPWACAKPALCGWWCLAVRGSRRQLRLLWSHLTAAGLVLHDRQPRGAFRLHTARVGACGPSNEGKERRMTTQEVLDTLYAHGWRWETLGTAPRPVLTNDRGGFSRPGETAHMHRRRQGDCVRCEAPVAPGKTLCAAHLQEARNRYYARTKRTRG